MYWARPLKAPVGAIEMETVVAIAPSDALIGRIRGEYREMPGLRLTFAQACRLWQIDARACDAILGALESEGFLARTGEGAFIVMPTTPRSPGTRHPSRLRQSA